MIVRHPSVVLSVVFAALGLSAAERLVFEAKVARDPKLATCLYEVVR